MVISEETIEKNLPKQSISEFDDTDELNEFSGCGAIAGTVSTVVTKPKSNKINKTKTK